MIVCNPPYVSTDEFEALDKNINAYEPKLALLAGRGITDQQDGKKVQKALLCLVKAEKSR